MADYVSSLNGSQMDQALIDMAEHNSEAWAVGERNGVPVGSDDVTYQNNAQYYAQQAQSIAPASVTEAVRWDIAQTALTDANKAQARANIDAGKNGAWSNRNLLDNAYFVGGGSQLGDGVFPINQRGLTSYSGSTYTIDRWVIASSAITVSPNAGYLELSGTAGNNFSQVIAPERAKGLYGKTVTASALMYDGTIISGTGTFPTVPASGWNFVGFVYGTDIALIIGTSLAGRSEFFLQTQTSSAKVCAVKLELGTVSTLANDLPPDFGEELRKCQRYFTRLSSGVLYTVYGNAVAEDAGTALMMIPLPVSMRATPTSVVWNNIRLYDYVSAASISPSSVYAIRGGISTPLLNVWCGVSPAMTAAHWLTIQATDASAYIEISAEL